MKVRGVKFTDAVEMLTGEKTTQYATPPPKATDKNMLKGVLIYVAIL